jgi:hypothetical protein
MRVPRDLDCSSQLNWSDYRTAFYRRIFLQPDCVILWGSEASEINTDQIHSLGGKLESFPEGSSSNTDKPGLSGGTLKIHARSGSGKVTVYSRGLDGSPGGIRSELLGSDSPEHAYNIALRFASAGGSAGSVHAKIDEDAPIYFDVRSIPGLSGAVDDFKNTPSTPYLPKGGISAKNGADGKICIEIGKSRTGDCG